GSELQDRHAQPWLWHGYPAIDAFLQQLEVARVERRGRAVGDGVWRHADRPAGFEGLRPEWVAVGLHADDLNARLRTLDRRRDATDEAAASDRHHDASEVRHVLQHLEPGAAVAGDHRRLGKRTDE